MNVINPATEMLVREYAPHSEAEVDTKLRAAERAFREWRRTPMDERARVVAQAGALLRDHRDTHARIMTEEMGKPISQALSEVDKCAWVCEFYAEHAADFLRPRPVDTEATDSFVRFDPLGPLLAIMPWNFPYWQVFRCAAPALMAGNPVVLKHAANVPGCALAIEETLRKAGGMDGCFTTLLVESDRVDDIIARPEIRAVSLTGSTRAGAAVAAAAGKQIKPCVLELGGSDPFIVLADADVTEAARVAVQARCINSGQSCIAAKRFIVEAAVCEVFEGAFIAEMENRLVGDPMLPSTDIGPLARRDLLHQLEDQVARAVNAGARPLLGGHRLDQQGLFFAPTVLTHVGPGNTAFDEETFGPVAAIIRAEDADDAVQLANRSNYGLGASLWTNDLDRARRLVADIETGTVFVNDFVKSDPRLPFGGVKQSGFGRELADFGIREFVNIKSVWIR